MLQRFLTLGNVPELRPDPIEFDKNETEIELVIPIDKYPQVQEVIKEMRYLNREGLSTLKVWSRFARLIYPCIITEKDKQRFEKLAHNMGLIS